MISSSATLLRTAAMPHTIITFHQQGIKGTSRIVNIATLQDKRVALFLESTPFHPVDRHWPDQPADKGILKLLGNQRTFKVIDCEKMAVNTETNEVVISTSVSKEERSKYNFLVGHIIDAEDNLESLIDAEVEAEVDAAYRNQLSLQHSSSHLVAFALNLATQKYWKKAAAAKDSLGSLSLDKEAIETAVIFPDHCEDFYRFGSSIKKKGLKVDEIFRDVKEIEKQVNETVREWISKPAEVTVFAEGNRLNDTRKWQCRLPQGLADLPCGGTHVTNLSSIASIEYKLEVREINKEKKLFAITIAKAAL